MTTEAISRQEGGERGRAADDRRIGVALDYVRVHCGNAQLSLGKVAALVNLSPSHLQRLLRQWTGHSYTFHIRVARVAKAKRQLMETFLTIKEISADLGYARTSHFDREFRRETGMTPTAWRRGNGSGSEGEPSLS
jgi:AraC-like DNA-binding protein